MSALPDNLTPEQDRELDEVAAALTEQLSQIPADSTLNRALLVIPLLKTVAAITLEEKLPPDGILAGLKEALGIDQHDFPHFDHTKVKIGFKGPNQLPLFMVIREYLFQGEVVHAEVVASSKWPFISMNSLRPFSPPSIAPHEL